MLRRTASVVAKGMLLASLAGCSNPLGRQYEYEEQLYLGVDGSATVVIDASIPALVALRGVPLDPSRQSSVDRDRVRSLFESAGCREVRVGQPWIRHGRRFVQVRIAVTHVHSLSECGPLAWSRYRFEVRDATILYEQVVGEPTPGETGSVNWDGSELVGFKLHAPSRIYYHNVKRLDGSNGEPGRGNILTWEQRLADRRAGRQLHMETRMGAESILFRTLWLFGAALGAAVLLLGALIWFTVRKGRRPAGWGSFETSRSKRQFATLMSCTFFSPSRREIGIETGTSCARN
jgi:hypothetical protein